VTDTGLTHDTFFSEEMLRAVVVPRFADAHVSEVREAGHYPHLERPAEPARVVAEFLAKLG
jgi:pimeloyl-ACP methyl ester carboxylesterase